MRAKNKSFLYFLLNTKWIRNLEVDLSDRCEKNQYLSDFYFFDIPGSLEIITRKWSLFGLESDLPSRQLAVEVCLGVLQILF